MWLHQMHRKQPPAGDRSPWSQQNCNGGVSRWPWSCRSSKEASRQLSTVTCAIKKVHWTTQPLKEMDLSEARRLINSLGLSQNRNKYQDERGCWGINTWGYGGGSLGRWVASFSSGPPLSWHRWTGRLRKEALESLGNWRTPARRTG